MVAFLNTKIFLEQVRITSLKYEKQIDSILVGFNFGCFQIWNMKTCSIESSSGFGENNKPIIGFSLLQPQNDPKKCIYLMVGHSSTVSASLPKPKQNEASPPKNKSTNRKSYTLNLNEENLANSTNKSKLLNEPTQDGTVIEIDNDDDDEIDSSFILVYQIMFERCLNIYLNQNENYMLYEVGIKKNNYFVNLRFFFSLLK